LLAQAQPAVEPLSAAAGTELRINQTCVSAEPPVVVINSIDIPAIGSNPLSTTALTLIGISGATGLIAVTMDHSKRDEAEKTRLALRAERDALNDAINAAGTGLTSQLAAARSGSPEALQLASALGVKQTRLNELTTLLAQPDQGPKTSRRGTWIC
jgi:hypothetical protein